MYPAYTLVFWIIIGGLVGWVATKVMDPPRRASGNVVTGVLAALMGGFISIVFFGAEPGMRGVVTSLIMAGVVSIAVVLLYRTLAVARRDAH